MLKFVVLVSSACLGLVQGHGWLVEPPGRASAWRYGFLTPRNYNDAELYCGGITRHWKNNKGKCGICGDPWDQKPPRPHEDGGKYGTGTIVRTYKSGQTIEVVTNIAVNHLGHMTYKICPFKKGVEVTQECLDKYPLQLADGSGTSYNLGTQRGLVSVKVKLPPGLTCERCVFQWHWKVGNNWGTCDNGQGAKGCGPQEFFRGCADIKIE